MNRKLQDPLTYTIDHHVEREIPIVFQDQRLYFYIVGKRGRIYCRQDTD